MEIRKHPKVNLERKRTLFFQTGVIISLLIALSAFNYKSYEDTTITLRNDAFNMIDDELVPITIQKEKLPPPPPKVNVVLNVKDNMEEGDDEIDFDAFANEETTIPDYQSEPEDEPESIPDDIPVAFPGVMPRFPGGLSALYAYLRQNIKYSVAAKEMGVQGTVYVRFVVEKDGSISNVEVLRGIGGGCDEVAVRVVKNMPAWIPGKQMGRAVRVSYTLPIKFSLQ